MIWENWSDFFAMGGYALYVWGSLLVVFAFMAGEVLLVGARKKTILQQIRHVREPRNRSKS